MELTSYTESCILNLFQKVFYKLIARTVKWYYVYKAVFAVVKTRDQHICMNLTYMLIHLFVLRLCNIRNRNLSKLVYNFRSNIRKHLSTVLLSTVHLVFYSGGRNDNNNNDDGDYDDVLYARPLQYPSLLQNIYVYVCMYVCIYVCMYVCMCVCWRYWGTCDNKIFEFEFAIWIWIKIWLDYINTRTMNSTSPVWYHE